MSDEIENLAQSLRKSGLASNDEEARKKAEDMLGGKNKGKGISTEERKPAVEAEPARESPEESEPVPKQDTMEELKAPESAPVGEVAEPVQEVEEPQITEAEEAPKICTPETCPPEANAEPEVREPVAEEPAQEPVKQAEDVPEKEEKKEDIPDLHDYFKGK